VEKRPSIDWQGARESIERTRQHLAGAETTSADRDRIFRQRAETLALPLATHANAARQQQIMVFRLDEERLALPLSDVAEVVTGAAITPVPGAPANVAGVIQVRGEIRPVFHLGQILGAISAEQLYTVILVRHGDREVGFRVDSVEDIRAIGEDDLEARRAVNQAGNPSTKYVTADLVQVLDLELLLDQRRETAGS